MDKYIIVTTLISSFEIKNASKEFLYWIDENIK